MDNDPRYNLVYSAALLLDIHERSNKRDKT